MPAISLPPLLILSLLACCIEVDISVPGFPTMARAFVVSEASVQLTLAINCLGFCMASVFYGPLSDCFGRRKVMIFGNGLLLIGAVGCVIAPTILWLWLARLIQGIGASTSAVVSFAMVADRYHGERAVELIGFMNAILTIFIAIAPVVGGFINETLGWRGNYGVVALISLVSWLVLYCFLPETKDNQENFSPQKILRDYAKLATHGSFIAAALIPSLLYAAYLSFVACAAFLYVERFGLSVLVYACHQGLIVGVFSVVSVFSDRITKALGAYRCTVLGLAFCLFGSLCLVSAQSANFITTSMALFCVGFALVYPVVFAKSLEIFPEIKGTASSFIMSLRMFVCASLIGLASELYNGSVVRIACIVLLAVMLCIFLAVPLLVAGLFGKIKMMSGKNTQSIQAYLAEQGLPFCVVTFPESTRTANEAAVAIGCDVAQIVKSLVFRTIQSGKPILVLASGANRVNEKIIATVLGEDIEKADATFTREVTGFAIGGIPPVGHVQKMETFVDADLLKLKELWAAAGSPHTVFSLNSSALIALTGGKVLSVV